MGQLRAYLIHLNRLAQEMNAAGGDPEPGKRFVEAARRLQDDDWLEIRAREGHSKDE